MFYRAPTYAATLAAWAVGMTLASGLLSEASAKELSMTYALDVGQLDPARVARAPDSAIIFNIYNGLLRFKPGTTEIEPDLAESWETSDDGLTYTFTLRDNVQFHKDYGPLTASDVKFTLDRGKDPALNSPFKSDYDAVRSVEVVDDLTVKIHMEQPYADFPSAVLAWRPGLILSEKAVTELGDRYPVNPIGTGAYMVESISGGESTFVANDYYHEGRPPIDPPPLNWSILKYVF